jgi:hypothetical protein
MTFDDSADQHAWPGIHGATAIAVPRGSWAKEHRDRRYRCQPPRPRQIAEAIVAG